MLRDADIESVALNPSEQERMIREYNHKVFENKQQQHGSIDASNVPASVTHLHLALPQSIRSSRSGSNFEAPLTVPKLSTSCKLRS